MNAPSRNEITSSLLVSLGLVSLVSLVSFDLSPTKTVKNVHDLFV